MRLFAVAGIFATLISLMSCGLVDVSPAQAATTTITPACQSMTTVNVSIAPGDTLAISKGTCIGGKVAFTSPTVAGQFTNLSIYGYTNVGSTTTFSTQSPGSYTIFFRKDSSNVTTISVTVEAVATPFTSSPAPIISGTAEVGQTLIASTVAWDPVASMTYQWLADGVALTGATGNTLLLQEAHYGKAISVAGTGTATGYKTTAVTSSATSPVVWAAGQWGVFFNANTGSAQSALTATQGSSITLPLSTKTGYRLSGWYTSLSGGTRVGGAGDSFTPTAMTTLYAQWTLATYAVTFDTQGGSTVPQASYSSGGSLTMPPAPTRAGYWFTGWFDAVKGTVGALSLPKPGESYRPGADRDITVYAQWTPVLSVKIDPNGVPWFGSSRPSSANFGCDEASGIYTCFVAPGGYMTVPTFTVKEGYLFDDWYATVGGQQVGMSSLDADWKRTSDFHPTGDLSFTARYTLVTPNVTYYPQGGLLTSVGSPTYSILSPIQLPTVSRSGYTFSGWYTASNGGTKVGDAGASYARTPAGIDDDVRLYAQYVPNAYTATFDTRGGSAQANSSYTYGTLMTLPAAPTRPGYTFFGWSKFPNLAPGSYVYPANHAQFIPNSTENFTVYAYWVSDSIKATFNTQGGSVQADVSFATNGELVLPQAPTRTGYTFRGWYTAASGGTQAGNAGQTYKPGYLTSDLTLHAQWQGLNNIVKYATGTTDAQVVAPQNGEFLSGAAFTPASAPIRAGYTFAGWSDGTGTLRSVTYTPEPPASGVLELTGQWTANKNTVKFDTLGGSAVADTTFETGGLFTVPQAPSRNGHRFTGWFDSAIGGNQVSGTFTPAATSGFTLFARWEKIVSLTPAVPQAILTLDVEAGARITGAAVTATASGLATNAEYTVELRSVPQIIARGYAVEGVVDVQTEIPAGLEPGWHTLTFRSISVDGTPITRVVYFEVSARGTLVSQSTVMPVELSRTGFAGAAYGVGGILLIIAGTVTTLFIRLISRRSQRP